MPPQVSLLINLVIWALMAAILGDVIVSWLRAARVRVPYSNPLVRAIESTADLLLRPIRRATPTTAGGLDFAPAIALILLSILQRVLGRL
jgi:uncharacterized protein YggT (Ycf19 family)